MIFFSVISD